MPTLTRPQNNDPEAIRQAVNYAFDQIETTEPWHEVGATGQPAFLNSWVNYNSAANATAAFYKDVLGRVHIKGLIKSGTITAAAFTLPEGYRPPLTVHFACASNTLFGELYIDNAGAVIPQTGSPLYFSLNVSFRAS